MVNDALEHVGEICLGIEAVQARCADQAIHRGRTFATGVGAGKQIVSSPETDAARCSPGDQVVDFRTSGAAVVDERRLAFWAHIARVAVERRNVAHEARQSGVGAALGHLVARGR